MDAAAISPPPGEATTDPMLEVIALRTHIRTDDRVLSAVNEISYPIHRGPIPAIVGEGGCSKSANANSLQRLIQPPGLIAGGQIKLRSPRAEEIDLTARSIMAAVSIMCRTAL